MKNCIVFLVISVFLSFTFPFPLAAAGKEAPIRAEVQTIKPFSYLCLECRGSYAQFSEKEKAFLAEFKKSGIKASGPELALYWNSPLFVKPEELLWDIGYPVSGTVKATGNLKLKDFPYKKVAATVHVGSYATTGVSIDALYKWITDQKQTLVQGPTVERYLDADPDKVPDVKKKTEILVPVK